MVTVVDHCDRTTCNLITVPLGLDACACVQLQLGPMLENAKFILEVREDKKTERAELIIIGLITAEIAVHLLSMWLERI
jgi:hypothetical protein